ncbi:MAG: FAD-dependent oxidoreductase [Sporolactobacillus sp.]
MSDEKFQVIVIGAGMAGIASAYRLAQSGVEVVLVDRGEQPGAKNVSGGRLYAYALEKLMPEEWMNAPFEREITREMMMMMTEEDSMTIDSSFSSIKSKSFSVLRGSFDSWMASKAEDAGAMVIPGTTVDGLIVRNGKVCGIKTGDEELEADLVISAEGVNPLVAERSGLIRKNKIEDAAVGVKQIYKLSESEINERFNVQDGQGAAMLCAGSCTKGISGGAFLYTNKASISVGIVADTCALKESGISITNIVEDFLSHPSISRYVKGAELIEYSAHLIPEGGFRSLPRLYSDGLLLTGDAAGLVVNRGFTVRGMDYAILSGMAAADTAIEAIKANNYSSTMLKNYQLRLEQNVLRDLKTLQRSHRYIAQSKHLFTTYPMLATHLMKNLYTIDGTPAKSVIGLTKQSLKGNMPWMSVMKDMFRGGRSL